MMAEKGKLIHLLLLPLFLATMADAASTSTMETTETAELSTGKKLKLGENTE